jgi:hypothetical protein
LSHPFQFPRTPTAQRLTTTILGPLRSDYAEQQEIFILITSAANALIHDSKGLSHETGMGYMSYG